MCEAITICLRKQDSHWSINQTLFVCYSLLTPFVVCFHEELHQFVVSSLSSDRITQSGSSISMWVHLWWIKRWKIRSTSYCEQKNHNHLIPSENVFLLGHAHRGKCTSLIVTEDAGPSLFNIFHRTENNSYFRVCYIVWGGVYCNTIHTECINKCLVESTVIASFS